MATAKKTEPDTAIVPVSDYQILVSNPESIAETLRMNLGDQQISAWNLDRVSVPSGGGLTWTIPTLEGDVVAQELEGIIVFFQDVRACWLTEFTGANVPPDCSSVDSKTGVPLDADSGIGGACADCPYAVFGSSNKPGGKGQQCKQMRRLFILRNEGFLPILVTLPPTSLKVTRQYFLRLAGKGIPFFGIKTKLTLEKQKNDGGIVYSSVTAVPSVGDDGKIAMLTPEQTATMRVFHDQMAPILTEVSITSDDYIAPDGGNDTQ